MTTQVTPGLRKAEDVFKALAWDSLVTTALASSGLNWWPMEAIARNFANKLFEKFRTTVDCAVISFMNESSRKAFDEAVLQLYFLERDKGADSEEYKNARKEAQKRFADSVRLIGS